MSDRAARRTALVTGASAGLGEALARRLSARGYDLVLVARRADRLEALAADLAKAHGAHSLVVAQDLATAAGVEAVLGAVAGARIEVEVLVNNAGFGSIGPFTRSPLERELRQVDVNVRALVSLTRQFLPAMVARRSGVVMNLGSTGSFLPVPYMATYGATKAFVLSFTEALSYELEGTGVHAMAVCPGPTVTEFQEVAGMRFGRLERAFTMTADEVVEIALRDMDRRRRISVTGWMNKLQVLAARFSPRGLVARVTRAIFARHVRQDVP